MKLGPCLRPYIKRPEYAKDLNVKKVWGISEWHRGGKGLTELDLEIIKHMQKLMNMTTSVKLCSTNDSTDKVDR